jgi:hypothetical protein
MQASPARGRASKESSVVTQNPAFWAEQTTAGKPRVQSHGNLGMTAKNRISFSIVSLYPMGWWCGKEKASAIFDQPERYAL